MKIIYLLILTFFCSSFISAKELIWTPNKGLEKWHALYRVKCSFDKDALKLRNISYDHAIGIENLALDPMEFNTLEITYRARISRTKTVGQFYFSNKQSRFTDEKCWSLPSIINDGKYHVMKVNLDALKNRNAWFAEGIISKLRLDMLDPAGGEIDIAKIRLYYDLSYADSKSLNSIIWESGKGLEKWHALYRVNCMSTAQGIKLTNIGNDHAIGIEKLAINPNKHNAFEIIYKAKTPRSVTSGQIYFANKNQRYTDLARFNLPSLKNDGQWHVMIVNLNNLVDRTTWLKAKTINKLRLDIVDTSGGEVEIGRIKLFFDPYFKKKLNLVESLDAPRYPVVKPNFYPGYVQKKLEVPYYTGKMIIHPNDRGQNSKWYLRKTFNLTSVPKRALVQYLADDSCKLFINGKFVSATNTWEKTTAFEAASFLKKGTNLIAIEYHNVRSAGGVLFDMQVVNNDGTITKIVSDQSFQALSKRFDNWETTLTIPANINLSSVRCAAAPPAAPWTKVMKYNDISRSYKLVATKIDKKSYTAGENVKLNVTLQGRLPQLPTSMELCCYLPNGIPLYSKIIKLDKTNVVNISSKNQWSFTCSYPLPQTLQSTKMTLQVKSSWEIDKAITASFNYQAKKKTNILNEPKVVTQVRQTPAGPRLFVNDKMVTFAGSTVSRYSKPDKMDLSFRLLFPYTPDHGTSKKQWWTNINKYDFTVFDLAAEEAIKEYPNAKFFVQVSCYPPQEWIAKYPGELSLTEDGKPSYTHLKINETPISFSSQIALRDIKAAVKACVQYLENSPYANKIAGYRIIGGHTAEWIGWGHANKELFDYSKPAQKAFLDYVAKHAPNSNIKAIPSVKTRLSRAKDKGNLLNEKDNLDTILYNRYYSDSIADMIIELCKTAKEACNNQKVVGTYYGYSVYTPSGLYFQGTGHYNLVKLLKSKAVDFVMSPPSYAIRAIGSTMADMKPFQTIADHGVLSFIEDDTRTHSIPPLKRTNYDQTLNPQQSVAVMRRNLGIALCRQQPMLLYPFYGIYHSEFSFPEMIPLMNDLQKINDFCQQNMVKRKADVALVFSEQSLNMYAYEKRYVRTGGAVQDYNWSGASGIFPQAALKLTGSLISGQVDTLSRSGVVCDYILSEDLANHKKDYKLYIFAGVLNYDEKFLQAIKNLRKKNVTLLWLYAPGYSKNFVTNVAYMKELTGFDLRYLPSVTAEVKLNDSSTTGIAEDNLTPGFHVQVNKNVKVLGKYNNTPYVGMAEIKEGLSRSIFSGSYRFSTSFMRKLALEAGAHVYTNTGDPLEANENLLMIHSRFPGNKTIKLKNPTTVLDVFERKIVSENKAIFNINMPLHTTKLFYCGDNAQELLNMLK